MIVQGDASFGRKAAVPDPVPRQSLGSTGYRHVCVDRRMIGEPLAAVGAAVPMALCFPS